MSGFLRKYFFTAIPSFSCNALKCVSINNPECKMRSEIPGIDSNEPTLHPYSTEVNKSKIHVENYVFLMLLRI